MKILQINKYHYIKGGSETVFFNTINLLEKHGNEVIRFCLKDDKNKPSKDERYFVDYPEMSNVGFFQKLKNSFSFFYNRNAKRKIEQLIKEQKPDIAHIHLLFNGISVSILPVLKKYNIPIVMSVHDYRLICPAYLFLDGNNQLCERCHQGSYLNCIINKCHNKNRFTSAMLTMDMYFRNLFFPIAKYIDQFIFVSNFTYSKHVSYNSVYAQKGIVLPNFIDCNNILPEQNKTPKKERYYLYYGRLSREKGLLTLIKAAEKLKIQLRVVGTGNLFEKGKEIDVPNIQFLGFKSGIELYELIQNAYFVIVPSECYETFGLTVVEPQVFGTPIIASKIGAIPELIEDDKTGFLFEPGDVDDLSQTIEKANLLTEEEYIRMSNASKKKSQFYSDASLYFDNLMRIYEKAIIECQN
jgi:Glycosyltransferase